MSQLDRKTLEQLKHKVQQELVKREIESLEYWLNELSKIYQRGHQTLTELKSDLRHFLDRMKNRINTLKTRGL